MYTVLLQVEFVIKEAIDGGGPSREFSCLLSKDISNSLFEGSDGKKIIIHNSLGLQVCA